MEDSVSYNLIVLIMGKQYLLLIFVKVTALNLIKMTVHQSEYPYQNETEWTLCSLAVFSKTNWNSQHASKVAES